MIYKWKHNYTDEEKGMALTIQNLKQEIDKLVDTNEDINREFSQYKYESKKEIERLNKELETLKQPQVFIDTQDMEERYGEELYKEYLEKENKRLNNIINELERYINEEYIYDELGMKIFDASKLQDKLQELKGSDK